MRRPPALPPPPPPPPPPSAPYYEVNSKEQLFKIFNDGRMKASVVLVASGTIIGLKTRLECDEDITVTIRGSGEGATFDGKEEIGLFKVTGGCSLTLERLNLVNGKTNDWDDGGAVHVERGSLTLIDSNVTNCKTDWSGGALYVSNWLYHYKVLVERSTFTSCSAGEAVRRHVETSHVMGPLAQR